MEDYLSIIIEVIVIGGVGYLLKAQLASTNTKLDKVLSNQEDHRVEMAEIKKDVISNKDWGTDSKKKIEDMQRKVNDLETLTAQHKEYIENEKRKNNG